jgi:hypothetical protein
MGREVRLRREPGDGPHADPGAHAVQGVFAEAAPPRDYPRLSKTIATIDALAKTGPYSPDTGIETAAREWIETFSSQGPGGSDYARVVRYLTNNASSATVLNAVTTFAKKVRSGSVPQVKSLSTVVRKTIEQLGDIVGG